MAKSHTRSWSRKRKSPVVFLLGLMSILGMTALGVYVMVQLKQVQVREAAEDSTKLEVMALVEEEPTEKESEQTALEAIEAASPLEKVILRHFAATQVNQMESIKLNAELQLGEESTAENQHQMVFYFRRPNLSRRVLMQNGLRLDMGFDGHEVWAAQVARNGISRIIDSLPESQKAQFRDSVTIGSYLWRYETEPDNFELLADEIVENIPCHVVAYENDSIRVLTYIDTMDYFELARDEFPKDGSPKVYMSMSQHRSVDGVVIPHAIFTMSNGAVYSSVRITDVEINNGLPSYLFERPGLRYSSK